MTHDRGSSVGVIAVRLLAETGAVTPVDPVVANLNSYAPGKLDGVSTSLARRCDVTGNGGGTSSHFLCGAK
ncbi:hypothetical protein FHT40_000110 [Mycolicibacterium sp. BK556]|uniref:hypothetical protein n=1 Tax=unclassified Mycolicibacterium TaxID=2636767 RepID=UPI0016119328|nr:hypothetical protein [Mycolicibacterium sp. BK556]MBB3630229.1 hypothetical protein [Mycolicibacterium sp. BK607]MBB3748229.1 hypothetical protein [Mycolicibacterium sp. BK634]